jgi:U3 small nucleolar RNA-associated protein 20
VKVLGPYYLKYVIESLRGHLSRGYQLHVLGYTIHSILRGLISGLPEKKGKTEKQKKVEGIVKKGIPNGSIDHCISDIMPFLMDELFGEVAEKKDVAKIAVKMKETGASKALHTIQLLSEVVSFPRGLRILLQHGPIEQSKQLKVSIAKKVSTLLQSVLSGLRQNLSIQPYDLLEFVYSITWQQTNQTSITNEGDKNVAKTLIQSPFHAPTTLLTARPKASDIYRVLPEPRKTMAVVKEEMMKSSDASSSALTAFSLSLLHSIFKNNTFQVKDVEHLQRLDPFVTLLSKCLKWKSNDVTIWAMKCLNPLCLFPLPSWALWFFFSLFSKILIIKEDFHFVTYIILVKKMFWIW